MTLYARSDVQSVTVGGGCGVPHSRDEDADEMALDCDVCEAAILADPRLAGAWADDPDDIPLTDEEERRRQAAQDREDAVEAKRRLLESTERAASSAPAARKRGRRSKTGK